jgi:hypothetical protein
MFSRPPRLKATALVVNWRKDIKIDLKVEDKRFQLRRETSVWLYECNNELTD